MLTTAGELVSFTSPAIAKFSSRFSPAGVLVASDLIEAVVSAVALVLILLAPSLLIPILVGISLIAVVFPAIGDVVEEFDGEQLAQSDPDEAMTFNASVSSVLAFVDIVVAMPLVSILAGVSIVVLIAGNLVLSAASTLLRVFSARAVVTLPLAEPNLEVFEVLGARRVPQGPLRDRCRVSPVQLPHPGQRRFPRYTTAESPLRHPAHRRRHPARRTPGSAALHGLAQPIARAQLQTRHPSTPRPGSTPRRVRHGLRSSPRARPIRASARR